MARRTRKDAGAAPGLFDGPRREEPVEPGESRESGPRRLTVGQLTAEIKARIEELGRIAVEGELSSLRRHTSGHVYFDLKDEGARLSCVVWRSRAAQAMRVEPEEGMQVVAHGRLDVYPPRGTYSLIVDRIEPVGLGALLARLEELKAELRAKGWFERRRRLPDMPEVIGVVTSRDGAALRDFLRTRSLRWSGYPVRLCHAPVQGPGAAPELADAIRRLDASGVDVIVVCRGGGSLEDLWAFNEREVAEAVWGASVPVVSGVGHESDTTLIDLVADHRAHTPTDAAQTVIPERRALEAELVRWGNFLIGAANAALEEREERVAALARRPALRRPGWILGSRVELLQKEGARLARAAAASLVERRGRLRAAELSLERRAPRLELERRRSRLGALAGRLQGDAERRLTRAEGRLATLARTLEGVSPLAVLGRGYSLTRRPGEVAPLVDAGAVAEGDEVETRLARGLLRARVLEARTELGPDR